MNQLGLPMVAPPLDRIAADSKAKIEKAKRAHRRRSDEQHKLIWKVAAALKIELEQQPAAPKSAPAAPPGMIAVKSYLRSRSHRSMFRQRQAESTDTLPGFAA